MLVTLEEMKNYLRVDDNEDDGLITTLLASAERMCMDILRIDEESGLQEVENGKPAVMYKVAYMYEHREEADHPARTLTRRSRLFGSRDLDFRSSLGVAPHPLGPLLDLETSEPCQLHLVSSLQRFLHLAQECVQRLFRVRLGQAAVGRHGCDQFAFVHILYPQYLQYMEIIANFLTFGNRQSFNRSADT